MKTNFVVKLDSFCGHDIVGFCTCNIPALEERNVEDGYVVVDELEQEHLEREAVLVLGVSSWALCNETSSVLIKRESEATALWCNELKKAPPLLLELKNGNRKSNRA